MISLVLLTELYDQEWNNRKARLRLNKRLQIIFSELLFLCHCINVPQIVIANINNISFTDLIVSSKKKMFRFADDELRIYIKNMMQAAPSLS